MGDSDISYQLRKAKIELEHSVLLKEMEIALTSEVAIVIAVFGSVISLNFYDFYNLQRNLLFIIGLAAIIGGIIENYREDRKEKIALKQAEIDDLLSKIAEQQKKKQF